jgi:hypothetical protein
VVGGGVAPWEEFTMIVQHLIMKINLLNLAIGQGSIVVAPLAGAMPPRGRHASSRVPRPLRRDEHRTFAAGRVQCRFLGYSG